MNRSASKDQYAEDLKNCLSPENVSGGCAQFGVVWRIADCLRVFPETMKGPEIFRRDGAYRAFCAMV